MENEKPENSKEDLPEDINWENRILCSDGNCIGVIGPDGRCKECGKKYEDRPFEGGLFAEDAPEEQDERSQGKEEEEESPPDQDWENRTLCSDENCIGVIGADGRCKECGKPFGESS